MFYSDFVLRRNFKVLWCLPADVCFRVVLVPQVGWEGADYICLRPPNLEVLIVD